jgi:hypothetical protein
VAKLPVVVTTTNLLDRFDHVTNPSYRFITNLDRWSALALMYAASDYQVSALRNGLERHLVFTALIEATQPVRF